MKRDAKNEVLHDSMIKAYKAGFAAGSQGLGEDTAFVAPSDYWIFDARSDKTPPTRAPSKQSPKKPAESNELAVKDYDPAFCKARRWNKGDNGDLPADSPGHGMQCWYLAATEGFCEKCAERHADESKTDWGIFCKSLNESPGEKDGKPHPWSSLAKEKKEKKEKD
jgi:hypothetical protein